MAVKKGAGRRVIVKQVKSHIGRDGITRSALRAIGLGRIGKSKELTVGPEVAGIIRQVCHLVTVDEVK